jgi:phenylalanyl-tRNA synthetase beta chain
MKISLEWLGDYVDLTPYSVDEIAARLTEIGHAVDAVEEEDGDTIFEIEFTTNRIDAMSHLGLAREIAAAFDIEVGHSPPAHYVSTDPSGGLSITIEDPELCSRYTGLVLRGVTIGPSAPEIQRRLRAIGLRPISNVVDATNYVMMAIGHPLHAFDFEKIEGREIRVRRGGAGETIRSLDGVDRSIDGDTVVIADRGGAVALGGIIGGAESEISEQSRDILLECAHFDPPTIRRSARRLGIRTDASYRFERGVDPGDTVDAINMAADLIMRQGGGTREHMVDVVAVPHEVKSIVLRSDRLEMTTAEQVDLEFAEALFGRLGMPSERKGEALSVAVPSYRVDLLEEIDLVEEVLRFFGFNAVPPSLPRLSTGDVRHEPLEEGGDRLRDLFVSLGLSEVITYAFIHPRHNELLSDEQQVGLTNALTENISAMRLSLLPGLLSTAAHNRAYGTRDGAIFEVGRTYHWNGDAVSEREAAAFVLFGSPEQRPGEARRSYDYFDVKGIVEVIGERFRQQIAIDSSEERPYRPGQSASVTVDGRSVGRIGSIAPDLLDAFEIKGDVYAGELDLESLLGSDSSWRMQPVSRFPGVPMVLGLLHDPSLSYRQLVDQIRALEVPHLSSVGLWDRFVPAQGERPEVKTALGLWYQAPDRSLTQDEVAAIHQRLTAQLSELLPVRIITT